jgi:hypothetical protein
MPRTALAVQVIPKGDALDNVSFTAGDDVNDHEFINTGKEILVMIDSAAAARTAVVKSVADPATGRLGDATLAPTGGGTKICMSGPFPPPLWSQSTGLVNVDLTDDTNITFAVVRFEE